MLGWYAATARLSGVGVSHVSCLVLERVDIQRCVRMEGQAGIACPTSTIFADFASISFAGSPL